MSDDGDDINRIVLLHWADCIYNRWPIDGTIGSEEEEKRIMNVLLDKNLVSISFLIRAAISAMRADISARIGGGIIFVTFTRLSSCIYFSLFFFCNACNCIEHLFLRRSSRDAT